MKLFVLLTSALLLTISANSQVSYALFAGPQATTAIYSIQGVKQSTKYKYGFQAGALLKVPFENRLSFSPGIYYSMKGYKVNFTRFVYPPDPNAKDNDTRIHTLETAFLLQYDFTKAKDPSGSFEDHFFIRIGPTLDFQLFGHEKFNTMPTGSVSRKMSYGFDKYGHYSANALIHLGYETASGLMIYGFYSHGMTSINNADDGPRIRHQAFGVCFGKYFNVKKVNK